MTCGTHKHICTDEKKKTKAGGTCFPSLPPGCGERHRALGCVAVTSLKRVEVTRRRRCLSALSCHSARGCVQPSVLVATAGQTCCKNIAPDTPHWRRRVAVDSVRVGTGGQQERSVRRASWAPVVGQGRQQGVSTCKDEREGNLGSDRRGTTCLATGIQVLYSTWGLSRRVTRLFESQSVAPKRVQVLAAAFRTGPHH